MTNAQLTEAPDAVLFDTTRPAHLARIGRLLWQQAARQPLLALGASSVAQALLAHWPGAPTAALPSASVPPAQGPVFLLMGSLSPVTAAQVHTGAQGYTAIALPATDTSARYIDQTKTAP